MPILALTTLAACGHDASVPTVSVVGDSLTAAEQVQLQGVLQQFYDPTYVVRSGAGIAEMSGHLTTSINSGGTPRIVIVNLGTYDALRAVGSEGSSHPLNPVVTATNGVSCVVLTTINVSTDHRPKGEPVVDLATRINHQIKTLAASNPTKYKIVDWNEFVSTLPAASVPTYLEANGVIPTSDGASWLAKSDLAAVRACGSTHEPTVIGPNNA